MRWSLSRRIVGIWVLSRRFWSSLWARSSFSTFLLSPSGGRGGTGVFTLGRWPFRELLVRVGRVWPTPHTPRRDYELFHRERESCHTSHPEGARPALNGSPAPPARPFAGAVTTPAASDTRKRGSWVTTIRRGRRTGPIASLAPICRPRPRSGVGAPRQGERRSSSA